MKKLSDVVVDTREIPVGNGHSFDVRGINLYDLQMLMKDHFPTLKECFDRLMARRAEGEEFTLDNVTGMLKDMLTEFPEMVLATVAYANDDPDGIAVFRRLPMEPQLAAIQAVVSLSIQSDTQLKKLVEMASQMLEGITNGMTSLTSLIPHSNAGISDSVNG